MHEVRLVGRGGQGVVTAGELLGKAALLDGHQAQSIPTFGPERRGALAQATLRIDDEEILLKCSTAQPDALLVLDPTIWQHANVSLGLAHGATLVFNSALTPDALNEQLRAGPSCPSHDDYAVCTVDATGIAMRTLGRPITNTAMMGALAEATGIIGMGAVEDVLRERFGARGEANVDAARAARDGLTRNGD